MLLVADKILGKATKEVTSGAVNFNLLPKLRCFQASGQSLTSIELNGTSNIEKVHVDFNTVSAL
ncbi:hypothetical protein SAMN05444395_106105 [Flavobacterium fryxellicola]|uniref:Uncharacterized protein n=1 Tax=Flavobacterium fryxellicola TaxID=249352 RepID=A0A162P8S6_9FLAO|nr:hypothetical protein [Flavobacterium fryxellicola]OAB29480.1 hypothetical protein FBFR_04200 [Flavobacterium fryxellicola]SHN71170.1 hypothetical protein SAMN05444395_106105 [Flavobacterium fryxellicola]